MTTISGIGEAPRTMFGERNPARPAKRDWLRDRRNSRGFTLVELMLVIIILGVAAAAAFPSLRAFADTVSLQQSARQASFLCGHLQGLAMQQDRICHLKIVTETGEFLPECKNEQGILRPVEASWAKPYRVPKAVTVKAVPANTGGVYFYPDATSDKATILFANAEGKKIDIEFGGSNGSISIR